MIVSACSNEKQSLKHEQTIETFDNLQVLVNRNVSVYTPASDLYKKSQSMQQPLNCYCQQCSENENPHVNAIRIALNLHCV